MNERTGGGNLSVICQLNSTTARNATRCYMANQTEDGDFNLIKELSFAKIYVLVTASLFGVILIASLVGSSLVTFTVLRRRNMRTPCNYFIMNIALADVGVGAIAAPLRILELFTSWPFGDFICHFLWPIQDVFVCVSVLSHTTIALERYRAIVQPFRPKMSLKKAKIVIVVLWLGCYCASGIPQSILLKVVEDMGWKYCDIRWPSPLFRLCYLCYLVLAFIIAPLVIQTYCYMRIIRALNRKQEFGDSTRIVSRNGNDQRKARQQRRKRMVRMLITTLVVFQVFYIPRGFLMLILQFQPEEIAISETFAFVNLICLVLYYCKHIVNPVILFAMSEDFRKAFLAGLKCVGQTERLDTLLSQQDNTNQESPQEATV